jgi:hypothetical protein
MGEPDMYIISNATVEDDLIKFDWVVGRHAFAKKGNVTFSVCLKDLFEGIVRREFNTTPATLPVLEGLETGRDLSEGHTDIFEQLREELTMTFLGDNPTGGVDNDTVDTWLELGYGFAWISELNQVNDQPSQYGFIVNYAHNIDVFQIFQDQMNGGTYIRCGDQTASWLQSWRRIPTTNASGELIMDGNIKGYYVTGEWLRTVAEDTHRTNPAEKIAVLDGSGWVYHRTPDEIRSDIGAMSNSLILKDDGDLTDLLGKTGRYFITRNVTGMPLADSIWYVDVMSGASDATMVIAYQSNTSPWGIYIKCSVGGEWGEWYTSQLKKV